MQDINKNATTSYSNKLEAEAAYCLGMVFLFIAENASVATFFYVNELYRSASGLPQTYNCCTF